MSWWNKLFRRDATDSPYGLHPDNPVLCGGGVQGEVDYLQRLRCPVGKPVHFLREGSFKRTTLAYLDRPGVAMKVSRGMFRRLADARPDELPLDAYVVVCECGQHRQQIFVDMYFRGPEVPIASLGWTLSEGVSPAEMMDEPAPCPYCGGELRSPKAKQCRFCWMDWHDPDNVFRSQPKAK